MTYARAMDKHSPCDSCYRYKDCAANQLLCKKMKAWTAERPYKHLDREPAHWIFLSANGG